VSGRSAEFIALMGVVTTAVFRAERALDDAIREYEVLKSAERAVVDSPLTSENDKAISHHGAQHAARVLALLRQAETPRGAWVPSNPVPWKQTAASCARPVL